MFISLILEKLIFGEGIKWERFTRNATLAWLSFVSIHKSHVVKSKDTSPSEVCAATLGTNRCLWKFRVWKFLFKTRKRWSKLKKKFSYNLKASWFDWRRTTLLGQLFLVPRISPGWKFYCRTFGVVILIEDHSSGTFFQVPGGAVVKETINIVSVTCLRF